jgi:diguanylate cyclase (GGDEF)-like protein
VRVEARRYLQYALLTAAAAVVGLLVIRSRVSTAPTIAFDAWSNRLTYLYLFAVTAIVFLSVGFLLGRQVDRLRGLATTDPLTGLANRRAFHARLREEWKRARRAGSPLSLLLIDIDGLKHVNDERGHVAGDAVISSTARAMRSAMRETDVGARWGGDEFAIIAPATTLPMARTLAHRLRDELRLTRSDDVHVTASMGIAAVNPRDLGASIDSLVSAADAALYGAKRGGRNRINVA